MKRLIYLIIGLMFIFTSCDEVSKYKHIENNGEEKILISNQIPLHIIKFKYENHDYLYFNYGHGISVVHNPDCSCKNKND